MALTEKLTVAPAVPAASATRLPGVEITGGALSTTVTLVVALAEEPLESVTVRVMVWAPLQRSTPTVTPAAIGVWPSAH